MNTFGERLKETLRMAGYSQVKAAQELQITKNSLNNYVAKNRIPEAPILYQLSKLVGVSMEWLLSGNDSEKYLTSTPPMEQSSDVLLPDEQEVLNIYKQLSYENKAKIRGMLEMKLSEEVTAPPMSSLSQVIDPSDLLA